MNHFFRLLILLFFGSSVLGISRSLLYDYGPEVDNMLLKERESSSSEILLQVPIIFYGETYNSVYVNANGILSFLTDIPSFMNIQFPLDYPVIAPFYANINIQSSGNVFFRETQDNVLLRRASESIRNAFSSGQNFTSKSIFIATWNNVGYYKLGAEKVNTFQVVIANSGTDSYVEYIYPEGGIQWIEGSIQDSYLPDARAQVGMVAGDGRYYTLRTSGTDQLLHIDRSSNVGIRGVWMFHIGQITNNGNVVSPDLNTQDSTSGDQTCETLGYTTCHSKAICSDYKSGFCCECTEGFFGNGINCLTNDEPLRVSGKLSGRINDEELNELDMQSYVITSDGRTYTAVSRVSQTVGYDMQLLNVIGSVIGWLFARPVKNAINGYELTGGVFNYTSTIKFPETSQTVVLRQKYLGIDVFNQLKMKGEVQGSLPNIPLGAKIEISEYEVQYTRSAPGRMFSRMNNFFRLEGEPLQHPFEVEHVVQYVECHNNPLNFSNLNMNITRNLVVYEAHEQIVRYGMTSKILFSEDRDPCEEGWKSCLEHSSCVVDGDSFKCICQSGYQYILLENSTRGAAACVDVNECASGINDCHSNADCVNEQGSYSCHCNAGYNGDGHFCEAENCIVANNCSPFATCQFNTSTNEYICVCVPGYYGDGISCYETDSLTANCNTSGCWCPHDFELEGLMCLKKKIDELFSKEHFSDDSCVYMGNCPARSSCQYDEESGKYACFCDAGFQMEENICILKDICDSDFDCIKNAECRWSNQFNHYQCVCREHFYLLNDECRPDTSSTAVKKMTESQQLCEVKCHQNAKCIYVMETDTYKCMCNLGYRGDGVYCKKDVTSCNLVDYCKTGEECVYDQIVKGFRCKCKHNYRKNGTQCVPEITCFDDPRMCGPDATCSLSSNGIYKCQCNEGFVSNGVKCTFISNIEEELLTTQGMAVLKITVSPTKSESKPIMVKLFQEAVGIDVDCSHEKVYWSDISEKVIKSAFYNGSGVDIFLNSDLGSLEGISIDWISRNLYWTDSHKDTIEVANLDHKGRKVLISQGLTNPRGIAVHPELGIMFWSDWNRNAPKLESANLDGTGRKIFLSGALVGLPNSLSIDWETSELCWADAGSHAIGCIGLDSSNPRIVIEGIKYPFGLAITPSSYFWTDWETQKVERARKGSGSRNEAISTLSRAIGKLYGIVTIRRHCPRVTNVCENENGLCGSDRLCLPKGSMDRNCACASFDEEGSGGEFVCNDING